MTVTKEQVAKTMELFSTYHQVRQEFWEKHPSRDDYMKYLLHRDLPEYCSVKKPSDDLYNFLRSLSNDAILDLRGLMIYGRELRRFGGMDGLREYINSVDDPEDRNLSLLNAERYFDNNRGYIDDEEDKECVIGYITEKSHLVQSLRYAMEALSQELGSRW